MASSKPLPDHRPDSTAAAVECREVTRTFGDVTAVDSVSLRVPQGGILAMVGPDGAGKTTLLRVICGVLSPDAGRVLVLGVDMLADPEAGKARLGYMPQRFSLYGDLSGRENLHFFADLYQVPVALYRQRASVLLDDFRLTDFVDTPARQLSGGMKQKLALACSLIHEPDLLVLDEPTAGVDPVSRRQFWRLLYGLNARGITVVATTPYMDEAEHASSVALMHRGRLIACDDPAQLRSEVANRVVEITGVPAAAARAALRTHPLVASLELFGETLHALVPDAEAAIAPLRSTLDQAGLKNASVRAAPPSLEDVFVSMLDSATVGARR
jgi:drug efflux transport system ATP-binding protein